MLGGYVRTAATLKIWAVSGRPGLLSGRSIIARQGRVFMVANEIDGLLQRWEVPSANITTLTLFDTKA